MWDIKYRPAKFSEVIGQPGPVLLLQKRLQNGTAFDTSYIFSGGHGQGKTTLARIHARAMLCQQLDKSNPEPCNECDNCQTILTGSPGAFSERDAGSQGTVDHVREIIEQLPYAIPNAPKRIYLFDEAHRMGNAAQDALLKPVEDKQMIAMFCTTEAEKIRGTIRSRCEENVIRKVMREEVLARMKLVLSKESVEHEDDGVLIVIDYCGGHVRDVLNKLETIAQLGPITQDTVRDYLKLGVVSIYYDILLALTEPRRSIELVEQACDIASPEDVAAGLAEAAMNSFRLANGMFADFVYVDRNLGKKVFDKYGAATVQLADYFLTMRSVSRVTLIRDALLLANAPQMPLPEYERRALVLQPSPQVVPQGVTMTPPVAPTPSVASPTAPVVPVAASAEPAPVPSAAPAAHPSNGNGKNGDLTYVKIQKPLTEYDDRFDAAGPPRMKNQPPQRPVFGDKTGDVGEDTVKQLDPSDWRRRFEQRWRPSRGADG